MGQPVGFPAAERQRADAVSPIVQLCPAGLLREGPGCPPVEQAQTTPMPATARVLTLVMTSAMQA